MDYEQEYLIGKGWTILHGSWIDPNGVEWGTSTEEAFRIQKEHDLFRFSIGYGGDDPS